MEYEPRYVDAGPATKQEIEQSIALARILQKYITRNSFHFALVLSLFVGIAITVYHALN
jgi:hypothetical protein